MANSFEFFSLELTLDLDFSMGLLWSDIVFFLLNYVFYYWIYCLIFEGFND